MDKPARPAAELIAEIIAATGVKQVVCVDDDFALGSSAEVVRQLCASIPQVAADITAFAGFNFDDPEVWHGQFAKAWENMDATERAAIDRQLRDRAPVEHLPRGEWLKPLFASDSCSFFPLTWGEWKARKQEVLNTAKKQKTLLLVDQDLSSEGASADEGIKIIADILQTAGEQDVVCVLLSHTFGHGQEHDLWAEFAAQNKIDRNRFMLASKERMNPPPVGIAMIVKLALINPMCREFRERITTVINDSIAAAVKRVNEINIYELERMVFAASRQEGVWEPDTLFRLFGVFQRAEARVKAKGSAELSTAADRIRAVSAIDTESEPDRPASWKIRRLEMYEDEEYLNQHLLPTESGDVFEGKSQKRYILLGQPCDLMVRSDGSRKGSVFEALVVRIVEQRPEKGEDWFPLDFFDKDTGADWFAIFRDAFTVPLEVLDLCALRKDGMATVSNSDAAPQQAIPSWIRRHDLLKKTTASILRVYEETVAKLRGVGAKGDLAGLNAGLTDYAIGRVLNPQPKKLFGGTLETAAKSVSFECRRIRRLCQPWASALLTQYSQYLSRAAFEHGFGSEQYRPTG